MVNAFTHTHDWCVQVQFIVKLLDQIAVTERIFEISMTCLQVSCRDLWNS